MVTTKEKKVHSTPEEKNPQQGTLILNYVQFDYTTLQRTAWKNFM
jgi:hypothetical protein